MGEEYVFCEAGVRRSHGRPATDAGQTIAKLVQNAGERKRHQSCRGIQGT